MRRTTVPLAAMLPLAGWLWASGADEEDKLVAFHAARAAARPDDAAAQNMLAGALIRRAESTGRAADYDAAWIALNKADAVEPGDPSTARTRARLLLSRHRFPQALALAKAELRKNPDDAALLGVAADASFETGDLDGALGYARRMHGLGAQLNTFARLSQIEEAKGNLDEAIRLMEQAIETGARKGAPAGSIAWCHAVMGELRWKKGRPDEARREYEAGLAKAADHPLVLEHLSELERHAGNLKASEDSYRRLLAVRPDPVNQLRLAEVLNERGRREAAAELRAQSHRKLRELVEGGNEGFLRPLAELEFEDGRFDEAAKLAARDLALRPNAESRALLEKILNEAAAAGKPVNGF